MTEVVVTEIVRRAWYTPQSLADELRMSRRSVYNLLDSGQLRSYKVPGAGRRIRPEDVDAYLAGCESGLSQRKESA